MSTSYSEAGILCTGELFTPLQQSKLTGNTLTEDNSQAFVQRYRMALRYYHRVKRFGT
jgi:hypothetical protein